MKNFKILVPFLFLATFLHAQSITFKGLEYKVIKSKVTQKEWLDRNLGATEKCESPYNKQCFGDYYQWGRQANGHEKSNANTTLTKLSKDTKKNNKFIRVKTTGNFDWRTTHDDTLWASAHSLNNVCPKGFRVPTIEELEKETSINKFFLAIPLSGYKSFCNGKLVQTSKQGALWSSSPYENDAYYLDIRKNSVESSTSSRADAFPVRCIKE